MINSLDQIDKGDLKGRILIGTVLDNADPTQKGRLKIMIPSLFEGEAANLPWVGPRNCDGPIANGANYGSFGLVPRVGDPVFVEFQDGDPLYGLYWKAPSVSNKGASELLANYPNIYGWVDPAGNKVIIDITPGATKINIIHKSGANFRIEDDGTMHFESPADINLTAVGNVNVRGNLIYLN